MFKSGPKMSISSKNYSYSCAITALEEWCQVREVILPLCSALVRPHLVYGHMCCVQILGSPVQGRYGHAEESPTKGHKGDERTGASLL